MKKFYLFFFSILFFTSTINAQVYGIDSVASPVTTCSGTFYDSNASGNYSNNENYTATFCAPAGQYLSFNFTMFSLGNNDTLFIFNGNDTLAPLIGTFLGTNSPGVVVSGFEGCLTFKFKSDGFLRGPGWTAAISCSTTPPPITTGNNCMSSLPFCTGTTYNFPNSTNQVGLGSNGIYGCLGSTPNPIWYHMQILDPGNIDITINQTDTNNIGLDIDFVLWGPFNSLLNGCGSLASTNIIDCSYSTAATEIVNIPNAQTGQFYVLLMTNYANSPGYISFSQTGGSGTTDCDVLRPFTQINASASTCDSVTGTYSVSGQVSYQYAPNNGDLIVSTDCGQSVTIPAPWTSPVNYTIPGLVADGTICNISASFTADPTRKLQTTYVAAAPCSPIGLNKNDVTSAFSLFPNPTNDIINIKSAYSQSWVTVEIINMYGNKLISQSFTEKLDISTLDNGIYSIVLSDANGNKFKQKLLKNSK